MPPYHARLAALLAAGGLACAGPTLAAPAPSFQDLLAQSAQAPRRAESQAQVAAAQGRLDQAGAWRNPELSLDVENFAGKGPMEGLDSAETTLSVSQTLELGGKRGARIDGARKDLDLARARDAQARADYAACAACRPRPTLRPLKPGSTRRWSPATRPSADSRPKPDRPRPLTR